MPPAALSLVLAYRISDSLHFSLSKRDPVTQDGGFSSIKSHFFFNSLLRNTLVLKQKLSRWLAGILLSTTLALPAFAQDLVVYTYDSFNTEWGPGPVVFKAFEEQCSCKVQVIA
ncbi:MAG: hypothetical protein ACO20I_16815, partial [bacterium]